MKLATVAKKHLKETVVPYANDLDFADDRERLNFVDTRIQMMMNRTDHGYELLKALDDGGIIISINANLSPKDQQRQKAQHKNEYIEVPSPPGISPSDIYTVVMLKKTHLSLMPKVIRAMLWWTGYDDAMKELRWERKAIQDRLSPRTNKLRLRKRRWRHRRR